MLSRKTIFVIVLLIIFFSAYLFLNQYFKPTLESKFHIENVSSIDKILIADRSNNRITLKRAGDLWTVNDKYLVREVAINTLLETANKIRLKNPVPKNIFDNVIKFMSTSGVYVEFYDGDKIIVSYTIGSNTPDHLANYMLLENSQVPYVVNIPSFNGFLSPRYGIQANEVNESNWRSHLVFNIPADSIKFISYTNYKTASFSYQLNFNPTILLNNNQKSLSFNQKEVFLLKSNFLKLNCEAFKIGETKLDGLQKIEQLIVNSDTLTTYQMSSSIISTKKDNFNVERKYATLNDGDLMIIQNYVFNKVLININELIN
tara:strand:+ start:1425 stop:2375 length:951 start_codon:yes stop_codon:yes gene_type:complete